MPNIFISYRRQDSGPFTGRIYDQLKDKFGYRSVFRDVYDIPAGSDFRTIIKKEVGQADIFLAIIGPHWVDITDPQGNRRLDNPNDFVRIEVESALSNPKTLVIPVLVDNTNMPVENELPENLRELSYRNALKVRTDPDFPHDMELLIRQIKRSDFALNKQGLWATLALAVFLITGLILFPVINDFFKESTPEVSKVYFDGETPTKSTSPNPALTISTPKHTLEDNFPTDDITGFIPLVGIKPEEIIQFTTNWETYKFEGEWLLYELPNEIDFEVGPEKSLNNIIQNLQTTDLDYLNQSLISPKLSMEFNLINIQKTGGVEIKVEKEAGLRILSYVPTRSHVNVLMIHKDLLGGSIPVTGGGYNYEFSPLSLDSRSWEYRSFTMDLKEFDFVTLNPTEDGTFEFLFKCIDPGIYQLEVFIKVSYVGNFSIQKINSPDLNCPESFTLWNVESDTIRRLDWWKNLQPADHTSLTIVKIGEYVLKDGEYISSR